MKKLILAAFAVALLTLGGTAFAADMIADGGDEKIDVGDVEVVLNGDYVEVTFTTVDGWVINETHVQVFFKENGNLIGIRLKNGNPAPGKFDFKHEDLGGVISDVYDDEISLSEVAEDAGLGPGTYDVYVAAHASVEKPMSMSVVSGDGQTMVTRRRAGNVVGFTTVNAPAVLADEPNPYPTVLELGNADSGDLVPTSVWDLNISLALWGSGADWIWESARVLDPLYGTVITLERIFDIGVEPTSANLLITCDNGYDVSLNGSSVGSANVANGLVDWQYSDLTQSYVNTSGWQGDESYDISSLLQAGENTLTIDAGNESFTDDTSPATVFYNPGACIFALDIGYIREETAWGGTNTDGLLSEQFPGKNWAIYFDSDIDYEVPEP